MSELVIMLLTSAIIFATGEGQEDVIKDYTKIMTDCVKDNQNIQNNNKNETKALSRSSRILWNLQRVKGWCDLAVDESELV